MKVIIAALEIEVSFLLKKLRRTHFFREGALKKYYGEIRGIRVLIVITGMGKYYARLAIQQILTTETPTSLLSIGYGGGLAPELKLGDICFIRSVCGPGKPIHFSVENIFSLPEVSLYTAEEVIRFPEEKLRLHQESEVHIVEMETYYLAEEVALQEIPLTCLRVVLDTQQDPLKDYGFFSPEGKIFFRKLLKFILQKPHAISELVSLQRKGSFASRKITDMALHWLENS